MCTNYYSMEHVSIFKWWLVHLENILYPHVTWRLICPYLPPIPCLGSDLIENLCCYLALSLPMVHYKCWLKIPSQHRHNFHILYMLRFNLCTGLYQFYWCEYFECWVKADYWVFHKIHLHCGSSLSNLLEKIRHTFRSQPSFNE